MLWRQIQQHWLGEPIDYGTRLRVPRYKTNHRTIGCSPGSHTTHAHLLVYSSSITRQASSFPLSLFLHLYLFLITRIIIIITYLLIISFFLSAPRSFRYFYCILNSRSSTPFPLLFSFVDIVNRVMKMMSVGRRRARLFKVANKVRKLFSCYILNYHTKTNFIQLIALASIDKLSI